MLFLLRERAAGCSPAGLQSAIKKLVEFMLLLFSALVFYAIQNVLP